MILFSVLFGENLFMEMSLPTQLLLASLVISSFTMNKLVSIYEPFELYFYNDHLVIYRPKATFNEKLSRKEINKMMYSDITDIVFDEKNFRFKIYGDVYAEWFDYNADGSLPEVAQYNRLVKKTLQYFSVRGEECVDPELTIQVIEANTPLKVKRML